MWVYLTAYPILHVLHLDQLPNAERCVTILQLGSDYGMSDISSTAQSRNTSLQRISFEFMLFEQELLSPRRAPNFVHQPFGAVLSHPDLMMKKITECEDP